MHALLTFAKWSTVIVPMYVVPAGRTSLCSSYQLSQLTRLCSVIVEATVLHSLYHPLVLVCIAGNIGDLFPEPDRETPVLAIAVGVSVGVCALLAVAVLIVVLAVARRCKKRASSFSPKEDSDEENEKVSPLVHCLNV